MTSTTFFNLFLHNNDAFQLLSFLMLLGTQKKTTEYFFLVDEIKPTGQPKAILTKKQVQTNLDFLSDHGFVRVEQDKRIANCRKITILDYLEEEANNAHQQVC